MEDRSKTSGERAFYRWTRDLHLYLGLFISPFVIAFAGSVLFLNHGKIDTGATTSVTTFRDIQIPAGMETLRGRYVVDRARDVVDRVGVTGEIGFVRYVRNEHRYVIPVSRPGVETIVDIDAATHIAVVLRRRTGVLESL